MHASLRRKQRQLADKTVDKVFDTFSKDDILRPDENGGLLWKGQPLTAEVIADIRAQARQLQSSLLWKILKADLQWFAIKTLMEKGTTADDLRFAQLVGKIVNQIDEKLATL